MFNLPTLGYGYEALEPFIDAKTMEIHHSKHHQAYVDNLNKALEKYPELAERSVESLIGDLDQLPEDVRAAVRNHGGGHLNHSLFWKLIAPGGVKEPQGRLLDLINKSFGDFTKFKEQFTLSAMGRFGSGWAWLVAEDRGQGTELKVQSTPNQDNPIMENKGAKVLLGLDVWEHAYYLKYQNRRKDYVDSWWNVVNWSEVDNLIS